MVNIGLFTGTVAFIVTTATSAISLSPAPFFGPVEDPVRKEIRSLEEENPVVQEISTIRRMKFFVTAYSSSPDETDDTPFITASGTEVRDGIAATNALPIGTKTRIPALFGDKIFVIEDRMHHRFRDRIDIWMPSKEEAVQFGKKSVEVEILE